MVRKAPNKTIEPASMEKTMAIVAPRKGNNVHLGNIEIRAKFITAKTETRKIDEQIQIQASVFGDKTTIEIAFWEYNEKYVNSNPFAVSKKPKITLMEPISKVV